ncbi:MAG: retropepsin-like domain-containing protein [Deltaproteobacteria bacterium]|nr:retropepsin-like domain-containing protein [Deltaproteobacteria bacterium]
MRVIWEGHSCEIPEVLVDTGSASTIVSADFVESIGVVVEPDDMLRVVRGVGGREIVFSRRFDGIQKGTARFRTLSCRSARCSTDLQSTGSSAWTFSRSSARESISAN